MRSKLCFFLNEKVLSNISQKEGVGSHALNYANDFNGKGSGDQCYLLAPFDCVVKSLATYDNTCLFESLNAVETPRGKLNVWFMCTHMNDVDFNALGMRVGKTFKQGEKCFREGTKGNASGNHIHFECGYGKYVNKNNNKPYVWDGRYVTLGGKQYKNFVPCIEGSECHINEIFYLEDCKDLGNIKSVYNWQLYNNPLPTPVERNEKVNQLKNECTSLRVRTGAGTQYESIGYLPQGIFNVDGEVKSTDYTWYQLGECWVAFIDEGMEYYPKKDDDYEALLKKYNELENKYLALEDRMSAIHNLSGVKE